MSHGRGGSIAIEGVSLNESAGNVILLITPAARKPLTLLSSFVGQDSDETSQQVAFAWYTCSAAGTGGNSVTPRPFDPNDSLGFTAKRAGSGSPFTVQPTKSPTEALAGMTFNLLNGWLYIPIEETRIYVPDNLFLGLFQRVAFSGALPVTVHADIWED